MAVSLIFWLVTGSLAPKLTSGSGANRQGANQLDGGGGGGGAIQITVTFWPGC